MGSYAATPEHTGSYNTSSGLSVPALGGEEKPSKTFLPPRVALMRRSDRPDEQNPPRAPPSHSAREFIPPPPSRLSLVGREPKSRSLSVRSSPVEEKKTDVDVEVHEHDVLPDDIYLLCSDGLPDMVEDEDIHLTISTFNASLDVVSQQLVDLAKNQGGRDNVSVMLAQVLDAFPAKQNLFLRIAGWFR